MKSIFLFLIIVILTGCKALVINGENQTFTDYVVLNKYSTWKGSSFYDVDPECFPVNRWLKWNEVKKLEESKVK